MAKDEGWYARNPKWKNIPQLMLRYRSASWLIRTVDPGCIMGLHTREEVEDTEYTEVVAENAEQPSVEEQLSQAQEKEKQEEIEERIDAAKEKKKENEELTEDILEGVQEAGANASDVSAAQQEIKDMMNKMKLIEDDIKGAAVDTSV